MVVYSAAKMAVMSASLRLKVSQRAGYLEQHLSMETPKAWMRANLLQTVLRWALSLAEMMVVPKVQKTVG